MSVQYSVNIDIQIDSDDDPVKVTKLVTAISEALEGDFDAELEASDNGEEE